ncbi:diguanylate cyclase [Altererythrobacter xixiisoli]|uniref:diguanylate cyclase n=1 Tax=Croceibacterium xixiisoli TaxID=1476466 RepID=A0A6I4TNR0_9SPHN|nr:sensor domain-containing diguanylate cyclase [Croceibacterium xixiisoli]MXO97522.1 diguanylate cyclase [Croceibacterium xixiisoli]
MTASPAGGIDALCRFIQQACRADLVLAVEVDGTGRAVPAGASSVQAFGACNLQRSGLLDRSWATSPVPANDFRLPSAILHALNQPPASLLFVPTPVDHAPASGLLLLWADEAPPLSVIGELPLLGDSIARLLSARRDSVRQLAMRDQFSDLFESVPSGIVLIDGDGQGAMINERAGVLLGCDAGQHRAGKLADMMRRLRENCSNREELERAYAAHVSDVNFSASMHWTLGERTLEVTTHPVRGEGGEGRIWLFTDVTAELMMAAELRRLATSDPLTGVPNRRHFEERSAEILAARQAGSGHSVTVMMLDVDHFKRINDNYGHPAGDEVLKVVARRCREALRDRDLFARFGGEEFIALLASSVEDDLPAIAERVRAAIADEPVQLGDLSIPITVSIGTATAEVVKTLGSNLMDDLIGRADEALYQAKQGGRNRVMMARS